MVSDSDRYITLSRLIFSPRDIFIRIKLLVEENENYEIPFIPQNFQCIHIKLVESLNKLERETILMIHRKYRLHLRIEIKFYRKFSKSLFKIALKYLKRQDFLAKIY